MCSHGSFIFFSKNTASGWQTRNERVATASTYCKKNANQKCGIYFKQAQLSNLKKE